MKPAELSNSTFNCIACKLPLIGVYVETRGSFRWDRKRKKLAVLGCLSCGTQYDPLLHSVRRVKPLNCETTNNNLENEIWISRAA